MGSINKISQLINQEIERQRNCLELIPSENYVSKEVLSALGSFLTNKYSEGYPGKRYYAGNAVIDEVERETQKLANDIFGTVYANVQPYSGSPANFAVNWAAAGAGGTIMGLDLPSGGHLTHGAEVSASGTFFNAILYHVDQNGKVDFDEVLKLAKEHKPKLIWVGGTAYVYKYEFENFSQIADDVGAFLAADISHVAGLVIGGVHPSPVPYAHIITTTTHKTLRGPRGAMILVTKKGVGKDPQLPAKIDKAVFPGLQGGPHNHQTAAIAVALSKAVKPEFNEYAKQVVTNANALAHSLMANGIKLVGGGTENHLMLIDLTQLGYGLGYQAHIALEEAGIVVNKNTIPNEPVSPFYPSGIRIGTPAVTSRGMKKKEMEKIAGWIRTVLDQVQGNDLPQEQSERQEFIKSYKQKVQSNENLAKIRNEVKSFASQYILPGVDE